MGWFLFRNRESACGNYMGREHLGVRESSTGDCRLHDQFLLPHQTFGGNECLSAYGDSSVCPGQFDGRLGTLFDLISVVFIKPLRESKSFLLYLDVFVQADKVRIEARDTGDSVHNLLSKNKVGDFLAVPGDPYVPLVQLRAKALQQWLRDREAKARVDERIVRVASGVSRIPAIVEVHAELSSRRETYVHPGACVYAVL